MLIIGDAKIPGHPGGEIKDTLKLKEILEKAPEYEE